MLPHLRESWCDTPSKGIVHALFVSGLLLVCIHSRLEREEVEVMRSFSMLFCVFLDREHLRWSVAVRLLMFIFEWHR
jgi:hypothetical protein